MTIYLGADHGGFNLKEYLKGILKNDGYDVVDCGPTAHVEGDDYPDYAAGGRADGGVTRAKPRHTHLPFGIRDGYRREQISEGSRRASDVAGPCFSGAARRRCEVLCFAADFMDDATAENIMKVFLSTAFAKEERYARRLKRSRISRKEKQSNHADHSRFKLS